MERRFEYVIKVEGKEVWRGLNPTKAYAEIKKQNPGKEVSIAWRTKEKVLVCEFIHRSGHSRPDVLKNL